MTGLSILFNLNTDEACYVYGHMESHRRANEQSIQQRYSGLPSPSRHRNIGDLRYTGSTDLSSYTPTYSESSSSRYRSHGFSDYPRDSYISSPTLSNRGLISDGDSMSKYTRGYDISNRNTSEFATKSYDSPRFYDRGNIGTDRPGSEVVSPPFEFGVNYKSPKTHDTSTKNHDITTKSYDRNTRIDDVTIRRSPARITSISDRDGVNRQAHADAPIDRRRQRVGSADSSSSHSSDKSAGTEDKSLFSALKHRYQETAEKQYDEPGARAPFSTWRRSGNFEEVTSPIAPEAQKEKTKSLERKTYHRDGDKSSTFGISYPEDESRSSFKDSDRSRSNVKDSSASSEKQGELSTDDLIFNFRQALRRHALSENEKALEHERIADTSVPKVDIEDDATAQRLERLRAARAKIQEQRQSDKVHSQSFATEFKIDKDKQEKTRSESASSVSSYKSDTDRVHAEEPVSKSEEQKQKHSTKLARQRLVSDDLRAKYMIKREDEKEKTPTPGDESLSRKRSGRKERLREHNEFWSKEKEHSKDAGSTKSKVESEPVPSIEEMLLGSSQTAKSSVSKKFQNVDHSSPFGSVYSKPSPVVTTTSSPVSSSASAITTLTSTYHTQPEKIEKLKNENQDGKISSEQVKTSESMSEAHGKKDKKYKKYAKAKSLELGALSKQEKTEPVKPVETKDDSNVDNVSSEDTSQMSRIERIAKYKEERRKQLKSLQEKFGAGDGSELPSLFLSGKPATEDTSVSRSKSMKVVSDNKFDVAGSAISRSRSLKQDKDAEFHERSSPAFNEPHKMPGLRLAEIGTQAKPMESIKEKDNHDTNEQKYNTDKIIDKLHALKKLKEERGKTTGTSHEEMPNIRYSKEFPGDMDLGKPVSYASKALLADRVMESTESSKGLSPARDRFPSSSSEREVGKTDKTMYGKPHSAKDTEHKSYFEFGTVFTKKEPKVEKQQEKSVNIEVKGEDDRECDSGKDSSDLSSRVRRKLPSVEDVLGTNVDDKFEKLDTDRFLKKEKETESKKHVKMDLAKEEITSMTAEEISRRKVTENIEKAKFKFLEDEKQSGAFDPSRFELGTVYTSKKTEKKIVPDISFQKEVKPAENLLKQGSLERTRQIMLGVTTENEYDVQMQQKSHEVKRQGMDIAQVRKESHMPYPEKGQSHRVETQIKQETLPETLVKDMKEEKQHAKLEEKSRKPPSSPRSERKKQAQEKFGKVSEAPTFEFGTSYTKKETVPPRQEAISKGFTSSELELKEDKVPKQRIQEARPISIESLKTKEKSPEPAPELNKRRRPKAATEKTNISTASLTSQTTNENQRKQHDSVPMQEITPIKAKIETQFKLDMKAQTVSAASGEKVEVPSSPRDMSHFKVFAKTFEGVTSKPAHVTEAAASSTEIKPMKFDIKSSKSGTEAIGAELKGKQSEQTKTTHNLEKEISKPVKQQPERQTSTTSIKFAKPESVKTPEATVEKNIEKQKVESDTPKERSEFTFESISKAKVKSVSGFELKEEIKRQESGIVPPQESIKRPDVEVLKPKETKVVTNITESKPIDKDEKKSESLFDIHKKQVEEKLERKRESIHVEDKQLEKQEKKSDIFEYHKKQIAELLDPRLAATHVEEKIISKPEIDRIGKHEIDSQMVGIHRKEIEDKLEPKLEQIKEMEKPEKIQELEKILKLEKLKADRQKLEKQGQAKVKVAQRSVKVEQKPVKVKQKSLMDTNLDDILSKNVEYLSDIEPQDVNRRRSGGKKERPQSIHEHHKGKRILKKKSSSRRSKSEDRSHFKVTDSDDDTDGKGRSKVTDDSQVKVTVRQQRSSVKVTGSSPVQNGR